MDFKPSLLITPTPLLPRSPYTFTPLQAVANYYDSANCGKMGALPCGAARKIDSALHGWQ